MQTVFLHSGHVLTVGPTVSSNECFLRIDHIVGFAKSGKLGHTLKASTVFSPQIPGTLDVVAAAVVLSDSLCVCVPYVVLRCCVASAEADMYLVGTVDSTTADFRQVGSFSLLKANFGTCDICVYLLDGPRVLVGASSTNTSMVHIVLCVPTLPDDSAMVVTQRKLKGRIVHCGLWGRGTIVVGSNASGWTSVADSISCSLCFSPSHLDDASRWASIATCAFELRTYGTQRVWLGTTNNELVEFRSERGCGQRAFLHSTRALPRLPHRIIATNCCPGSCLVAVLFDDEESACVFQSSIGKEKGACKLLHSFTGVMSIAVGDFAGLGFEQIMITVRSTRINGGTKVTIVADSIRCWTYRSFSGVNSASAAETVQVRSSRVGLVDVIGKVKKKNRGAKRKKLKGRGAPKSEKRKRVKAASRSFDRAPIDDPLKLVAKALNSCLCSGSEQTQAVEQSVRDKAVLLNSHRRFALTLSQFSSELLACSAESEGKDKWGQGLVPLLSRDMRQSNDVRYAVPSSDRVGTETGLSLKKTERPFPQVRFLRVDIKPCEDHLFRVTMAITNVSSSDSIRDLNLTLSSQQGSLHSQCHGVQFLAAGKSGSCSAYAAIPSDFPLADGVIPFGVPPQGLWHGDNGSSFNMPRVPAAVRVLCIISWRWADSNTRLPLNDDMFPVEMLTAGVVSIPHAILLCSNSSWVRPLTLHDGPSARSLEKIPQWPHPQNIIDHWCTRRWQLPLFLRSRTTDLTSLSGVFRSALLPLDSCSIKTSAQLLFLRTAVHSAECTVYSASPLRLCALLDILAGALPDDVTVSVNSSQKEKLKLIKTAISSLGAEVDCTTKSLSSIIIQPPAKRRMACFKWWTAYLNLQRRSDMAVAEIYSILS